MGLRWPSAPRRTTVVRPCSPGSSSCHQVSPSIASGKQTSRCCWATWDAVIGEGHVPHGSGGAVVLSVMPISSITPGPGHGRFHTCGAGEGLGSAAARGPGHVMAPAPAAGEGLGSAAARGPGHVMAPAPAAGNGKARTAASRCGSCDSTGASRGSVLSDVDMNAARTYQIRTFGCQMNFHDSERLAGLLEESGYQRAEGDQVPDVVVFNTCAVRENADNRLYGNLGQLLPVKAAHPGMQIAVGGCLAQKDRAGIAKRAPWVDVVFGTHNIGSLPALLQRAQVSAEAQVEIVESLERFPSVLPARRESPYAAWVAISVGCNNTCTFCIVPSLRGREEDRRPGDVLAEVEALASEGVLEVTLLGQNVNSYGVGFGDRLAFGKLLRSCGTVAGLERVRFTSPHPRDFTVDVIEAMAETPNVMPQLHMPLQSGSDAVLRAMRRAYRREKYLAILDRVRVAIPEAAITTDIIVGFPGETEQDFAGTLDLVRQARFAGAFTFIYSPRPGTPAAALEDQVPAEIVRERYGRLVALVEEITLAEN